MLGNYEFAIDDVASEDGASAGALSFTLDPAALERKLTAARGYPEMREEITSIQWLGFALTEAIVFYAFIFGLIAFFL